MKELGKVDRNFWKGKKVFLTGHTGFKGSWLGIWLNEMGAELYGYAMQPDTKPSLFEMGNLDQLYNSSTFGEIADFEKLKLSIIKADPDIIIHMAAQPLVRKSYRDPIYTYQTNVMGTVNILEAARSCSSARVLLNVTTDKCYANQDWHWGYRETEPLGGSDPYSSSKACSEIVTEAYRKSFLAAQGLHVGTARAGNVIGGGDWAEERLIPDLIRSFIRREQVEIRYPHAIRPWQHVLEPLSGYLVLCQRLYSEGEKYAEAWNFGPQDSDAKPVEWIVKRMLEKWPDEHSGYKIIQRDSLHEERMLKLDCSKAQQLLGWGPRWSLEKTIDTIVEWVHGYNQGRNAKDLCIQQIKSYESSESVE